MKDEDILIAEDEMALIKSAHELRNYIRTDKNLYNDSDVMEAIATVVDAWEERIAILGGCNEEYDLDDRAPF